jgi:CubicO group peptidase (beta-lactamase class C family)
MSAPHDRRRFLGRAAAGLAALATVRVQTSRAALPTTGEPDRRLESFDKLMTSFVEDHRLPGAALAVTRNGKLVYARGFGFADEEKKEPVQPAALFRIASVTKPITATAVLQLADKNKFDFTDPVLKHIPFQPHLAAGAKPDPRWHKITIRQLLHHTGGWDRDQSYDPIGIPWKIAKAMHHEPPVPPSEVVNYMMGQPFDFDPGARMAYSNLGYLVLGRLIEAVTKQPYEAYVRKSVLAPLGITSMKLGRALAENRTKGEVMYYDPKHGTGPALYPPKIGQPVPIPYGAENFEGFESHGGWIASAPDLVRFASAFDQPRRCPILSERGIETMWERPPGRAGRDAHGKPADVFYACGWEVRPVGATGRNTWHNGGITGTSTLLVRRFDGLNWGVLFNTNADAKGKAPADEIDTPMHAAADAVKSWPTLDRFDKYLSAK